MYRATTYLAQRAGVAMSDDAGLAAIARSVHMTLETGERLQADGEDVTDELRTPAVEKDVSVVAQVPGVRAALIAQQQRMAEKGGVVMVGRDIGTKVLPSAAKFYLDASPAVRAQRRLAEAVAEGGTASAVRENLDMRDRLDLEQNLREAEDAVRIVTDELDVGGVADCVMEILQRA
jgi:cytidylate kinase